MITTGPDARIRQWTSAAQSLLGYRAAQVLGRPLFEILEARDVFGNRYCSNGCGLLDMISRGEPVRGFELEISTAAGGRMRVFVSLSVAGRNQDRLVFQLRADLRRQGDRRQVVERRRPSAVAGDTPGDVPWPLSPRELDVLRRLAGGADTRDLAAQLRISATTARNHAQAVLRKMGVHSRAEAVSLAYRHKLV